MIILSEKNCRETLFPFTHTRHTAELPVGMLTIKQKWEILLGEKVSLNESDEGIKIPANVVPTLLNYKRIIDLFAENENLILPEEVKTITHPWDLFKFNDDALRYDYTLLTKGKISERISDSNKVINPENIFLEEGAIVEHSFLNADKGPIYISAGAQIMEGSMIRGPFYLGKNSIVKMGAKIYGATSIAENCTIGGEIKNSILFANSNKAHDGYLGDSVIGECCNLGAGTTNSNVKNTAGSVYYHLDGYEIDSGNKAGLIMGDYSRAAINTAFNTGTIVGICCNIFNHDMKKKIVENFTWGDEKYIFEKAIEHTNNWLAFKNQKLTSEKIALLKNLYCE